MITNKPVITMFFSLFYFFVWIHHICSWLFCLFCFGFFCFPWFKFLSNNDVVVRNGFLFLCFLFVWFDLVFWFSQKNKTKDKIRNKITESWWAKNKTKKHFVCLPEFSNVFFCLNLNFRYIDCLESIVFDCFLFISLLTPILN